MATGGGRSKPRFIVKCDKHGTAQTKEGWKGVVVGKPKNRGLSLTQGCPLCKGEPKPEIDMSAFLTPS